MARRALTWVIVPPLIAAGVLVAHWAAYQLVPTPLGGVHDYLAHAPQVLMIAGVLGLLALGGATRVARPGPAPFVTLGTLTFCLQEHLERLAHTGHLPFLLTTPVFLVGVALQLPVALLVWLVARWVLAVPGSYRPRRPRPAWTLAPVVALRPARVAVRCAAPGPRPGRGPPSGL
jgi:hypothetical protein